MLSIDCKDSREWINEVTRYFMAGNLIEALRALKELTFEDIVGIDLSNTLWVSLLLFGQDHLKSHEQICSISEALDHLVQISPERKGIIELMIGGLYADLKDYEAAKKMYRKAYKSGLDDGSCAFPLYDSLAWQLEYVGDYEMAIAVANEELERKRNLDEEERLIINSSLYGTLAKAHKELEHYQEAVIFAQKLIRSETALNKREYMDPYLLIAIIYECMNDWRNAQAVWQKISELPVYDSHAYLEMGAYARKRADEIGRGVNLAVSDLSFSSCKFAFC